MKSGIPHRAKRAVERRWIEIVPMMDGVERTTIANALRIAADQYDRDAKANRERNPESRVAVRFQEQCDHCRLIADLVEL